MPEQDQYRFIKTEALKNDFWRIKQGTWSIDSCNHNIHKTCYEQYLATNNNQKKGDVKNLFYQFEYKCPLCINSQQQQFNTLTVDMIIQEDQSLVQQFKWETMALDTSLSQTEQDYIKIQQNISEYEQMNKKRKCRMNSDEGKELTEFKYKKYEVDCKKIDFDYLSNQIEIINTLQYQTNESNQPITNEMEFQESGDENNMNRIENIILNQLRLTDFDCSPISLVQHRKKLSLLRQILNNLNKTLSNKNSTLSSFYSKRYKYCQDFMNLLNQIQYNLCQSTMENNLLENDLKEMYFKYLFYSINYFKQGQDVVKIIQNTINQVLLAKFVQIHILIKSKQNKSNEVKDTKLSVDEISTFNDNERCQYNIDILQRTWNLLSLFFDFDSSLQSQLNRIFDDSKDEVSQLLKFFKVEIPSNDQQLSFVDKMIKCEFNFNNLNIYKIKANNTSFNFISLENKFSELFKKYQSVKCSKCNDFPKFGDACICLICGELLCSFGCEQKQDFSKGYVGNLNKHCIELHCNSSIFLDLSNSTLIYVSYPYNQKDQELYLNNFGIPFKKSSNDWSQFQLDNSVLSKMYQTVINLNIIDYIKIQETKNGIQYRTHVY